MMGWELRDPVDARLEQAESGPQSAHGHSVVDESQDGHLFNSYGLADEKAVAGATKTFTATGSACANAVKALPSDPDLKACSTRLAALGGVRVTGTKVQDEWSTHMRMMSNKVHTDAGAYHQTWVKAVSGAKASLGAHANAVAAVTKAPACA